MTAIRALEQQDLPAVASLVRAHLRGWRRDQHVLATNLIEHPWASEPLRTLVAVSDDGQIIGSIGAQERRLLFDGSELRGVCVSHLVVDPAHRAGASGALLVRRLLSGDQDLTWTDSGTEGVVRIWRAFGAHVDHSRTCDWMLVLRPARWLSRIAVRAARGADDLGRRSIPVGALPAQALGRRLVSRAFPELPPDVSGEQAEPAAIAESLPAITRGVRLRLVYDQPYLDYLFAYLDSLTGPVVRRLVRRAGAPIGWYAYLARPAIGRVICVAANVREIDAVVADLVGDAHQRGVAVLAGRLEPHLDEPLRRRLAVVGFAQRPLIHARDPAILAALASSASLLTEIDLIDSEWW